MAKESGLTGEPFCITRNGEADHIVISIEAFNQRVVGPELKEKLRAAEEQLAAGIKPVPLKAAMTKWRGRVDAIHGRDTLLIRKCYAFDMKMIRF